MIEVIGIGAGGHAKVVIETIQLQKGFSVVGLLDAAPEKHGTKICNVPVLGDDSMLGELYERGIRHAFMALGSVNVEPRRKQVYERVRSHGFEIVSTIHPTAAVSPSARLGTGVAVFANAVVNADSQIGDNVIINSGAIVEHDCLIGDHVHLATGARLAGAVNVGAGTHIGAGALVLQGLNIGENSLVAAGAVVIKDVPDCVAVLGVPAKIHKRTNEA